MTRSQSLLTRAQCSRSWPVPTLSFAPLPPLPPARPARPSTWLDHLELSDFHTLRSSTGARWWPPSAPGGSAPIVAALVRAELEARLPAGLGRLVELFGKLRDETRTVLPDLAQRRAFLRAMLSGRVAAAADAGRRSRGRAADGRGARRRDRTAWGWSGFDPRLPVARDLLSLRGRPRAGRRPISLVLGDGVATDVAVLARRDAPEAGWPTSTPPFLAAEARDGPELQVIAGTDALTDLALALGGPRAAPLLPGA